MNAASTTSDTTSTRPMPSAFIRREAALILQARHPHEWVIRSFNLFRHGGTTTLRSPMRNALWGENDTLTAWCHVADCHIGSPTPSPLCTCGIYGYGLIHCIENMHKQPEPPSGIMSGTVFGLVMLTGKVRGHGYVGREMMRGQGAVVAGPLAWTESYVRGEDHLSSGRPIVEASWTEVVTTMSTYAAQIDDTAAKMGYLG